VTRDGRPEDEQAEETTAADAAAADRPDAPANVAADAALTAEPPPEPAPQAKAPRSPLPRYQPPAPAPVVYPRPAPAAPADAVAGYRPPAGGVWTPPPQPPRPAAGTLPAIPAPLHMLSATPPKDAGWGWTQALWGLLLGMGPTFVLYAATASSADDTGLDTEVSVATGIIILISSALSYGWDYFAAWLFSGRRVADKWRAWGFRKPTAAFFWVIPVALVAAYVVSYVNEIVFHPAEQEIVDAFPPTAGGIILFAIVAVVMAPLFEELYFRGFLFKGFATSWGWGWGAVASAAIFSLAHMQLTLFLPLFALGFGLAWVYRHTGSLWTSITLHAIFNGVSVLAWALTS
jgi:membrane protease YdiL (CAAX protease family)